MNRVLKFNPGFYRRTTQKFIFYDYTPAEIASILFKIKGNKVNFPATVDSAGDVESIGSLFHEKYKNLYNCVSYDDHQVAALKLEIDNQIM